MSLSLSDLLSPDRVLLDLSATNEAEAIQAVTTLLSGHPDIGDVRQFTAEVLEREALSCTAMDYGVAFPHARTAQVRRIVMAVGRSPAGVPFKRAADLVHFIFVIGTTPGQVPQYLAAVGKLARVLRSADVRARLMAASTAEEFLAPLTET